MEKKRIHTENAPAAIGPYSQAIDLGEMIFTSGQIPVAPDGSVSEDISEQTRQALLNLKAVVEAGGSSFDKVIKTTVFINIYRVFLSSWFCVLIIVIIRHFRTLHQIIESKIFPFFIERNYILHIHRYAVVTLIQRQNDAL